jgi:hypothetical protein
MSNLKVNTINDASGGSNAVLYGVAAPANSMGFRNRIINGDMRIDQRNAGASVTIPSTLGQYTLDRWTVQSIGASKFTVQQTPSATETGYATRVSAGFTNYLAITSLAATSISSGDYYALIQRVEGFNFSDLAWGTASAKPVILSFLVYSSLTGTFSASLKNASDNRSYPFTFTVGSANTWTSVSVSIAGDTSGTWVVNNGIGVILTFDIGCGSTYRSSSANAWQAGNYYGITSAISVIATNGATFYITGVQLEAGSVASPFERRDYGRELIMCQRYLPAFNGASNFFAGQAINTTTTYAQLNFPVTTRVAPTGITTSAVSGSNFISYNSAGSGVNVTALSFVFASPANALLTTTTASGLTAGNAAFTNMNVAGAQILFTGCEL